MCNFSKIGKITALLISIIYPLLSVLDQDQDKDQEIFL
jgi:hypothetical protein